jgi:hypothetical protein
MDEQNLPPTEALTDQQVTKDLIGLPSGSAVLQLVLHRLRDEPGMAHLETRMVMIGTSELDMSNPAHRVAVALQTHLPAILAEALQAEPVAKSRDEIADSIAEAAAQAHLASNSDAELMADVEGLGTMAPLASNAHGIGPDTDPDGLRLFDNGNKNQ